MPDDQLSEILDAMRARIQAQLDAQRQALNAQHEQALARVRVEAAAEAERRWTSKVDAIRNEWSARLESEITAARAEAERRFVGESMRAKAEAERELELAVAAERQRTVAQLDEERKRAELELEHAIAALDAERRQQEGEPAHAERRFSDSSALLGSIVDIEHARSLSDALAALVRAAAAHAPRTALFIVHGTQLDEWSVAGVSRMSQLPIGVEGNAAGLAGIAVRRGERISTDDAPAPAFAELPAGAAALAVPLMMDGQPVAVLYADAGGTGSQQTDGWAAAVELLARHAASRLAELTAVRALQLFQAPGGNGRPTATEPGTSEDSDQSAKRYARLLVSEIKLYNEGAVRAGREHRDLLQRLGPEIERARRLYEERVPSSVAGRASYFQQELVHTLAGGDATLL